MQAVWLHSKPCLHLSDYTGAILDSVPENCADLCSKPVQHLYAVAYLDLLQYLHVYQCSVTLQQTSAVSTEQYVQETVSAQYTSYYGSSSSSYYYRAAEPRRWYQEECTSYCWVPVQTYESYQCSQQKKQSYSYPCQTYEKVSTTYQCGQYQSQQETYKCEKYKQESQQQCQYVQESYCVEYGEECQEVSEEVSPSEISYYGEAPSSSSYYY
ncbi:hypothetical protein Gasu2_40930 [Galdieria sulphuraria]|nr:hypothetical protein Gasu2_40930 [Galdieria sulphuraria]